MSSQYYYIIYVNVEHGAGILFVCLDDNTLLLIKRSNSVSEPGVWGIPGGSIEDKETPSKAARREVIEELGSFPNNLRPIQSLTTNKDSWKYITFVVEMTLEEKDIWTPNIKLNYESEKAVWFRLNKLPKNLHSAINIIQT